MKYSNKHVNARVRTLVSVPSVGQLKGKYAGPGDTGTLFHVEADGSPLVRLDHSHAVIRVSPEEIEIIPLNVNGLLQDTLVANGCKIEVTSGIWYVTTPDGRVWDMTIPQLRPETKAHKG